MAVAEAIEVRADDVSLLSTPTEYFEQLCRGVATARKRIVLSSLYLGTRLPAERRLLELLARAAATPDGPSVLILLDALRSTRPIKSMTTPAATVSAARGEDKNASSTRRTSVASTASVSSSSYADDIAASILAATPQHSLSRHVRIALFHTPLLPPLARYVVPRRFDEVFGVQHAKCAIFDDDVLVSGANLSETYFTTRQDRYALFSRVPSFADAMHEFVETVAAHSYDLGPDARLRDIPAGTDPRASPADFCASLRESFMKSGVGSSDTDVAAFARPRRGYALVYPLVQAGFAGVMQETHTIAAYARHLSSSMSPSSSIRCTLASAYLNLSDPWRDTLTDWVLAGAGGHLRLVPSSAQSHGFGNASGIAGLLPYAYQLLRHESLASLRRGVGDSSVELVEYARPDWEYHCKGIWLETQRSTEEEDARGAKTNARLQSGSRLPFASVVGSSNYGARSAMRDIELQLLVRTEDAALQARFGAELAALEAHAVLPQSSGSGSVAGTRAQPRYASRLFVRFLLPFIRHLL